MMVKNANGQTICHDFQPLAVLFHHSPHYVGENRLKGEFGDVMKNLKTILSFLAVSIFGFSSSHAIVPSAFQDATDLGGGFYESWFGTFYPFSGELSEMGWVYHHDHGVLYLDVNGDSIWLYDQNTAAIDGLSGWIFTSRDEFPHFWVQGLDWLLFVEGVQGPDATPRVFASASLGTVLLPKATTKNIVEVASANSAFSSLVTAVSTAGLVDALSGDGPLTVFAPTDDAFAKLDPATLNDLLTNPDSLPALSNILQYHVVPGRITSDMLGLDVVSLLKGATVNGYVEMLNGDDVRVDVTPFGLMLNGSAMVTQADLKVGNGVIHVIDEVLLPPMDIVDTAVAAGFSTLVTAVQAAGLEGALRGEGPLTVFAPTEDAFAALGDTLNDLIANPTLLADILAYHVVDGEVYSANVAAGPVTMLNGDEANISVSEDGMLMINDATIVTTDIVTSNGVIHVIDTVILPPAE